MRCLMANTKHEDAIMKREFGYFCESILKRLEINYEFVAKEPILWRNHECSNGTELCVLYI